MAAKPYFLQMGMGVDLHGQNPTEAARRAVHNAIANNCLSDNLHTKEAEKKVHVHVLVACPKPNEVNKDAVLKEVPFGVKTIEVQQGGMITRHCYAPQHGDKTDESLVANAAVTISLESEAA